MNPSYIFLPLLALLLAGVLLLIYYRMALRFVRRWSATSWTPTGWM